MSNPPCHFVFACACGKVVVISALHMVNRQPPVCPCGNRSRRFMAFKGHASAEQIKGALTEAEAHQITEATR